MLPGEFYWGACAPGGEGWLGWSVSPDLLLITPLGAPPSSRTVRGFSRDLGETRDEVARKGNDYSCVKSLWHLEPEGNKAYRRIAKRGGEALSSRRH